ncbi:hypothetical protein Calag_0295 [Caldisphaera lagunensis DSM 15908]|uniref:GTP cyclohydrolase IV n=1 Tax=Caldisphaera lagunensis (strain DSM 15908 / JCM 11604 / ANMR 0165 / IC-154) TaxID=1056495 RepID=L0AAL1_CALLD|nr:hypothetical protein Calag_0295 [Caldisphaera lagunensis DSM 15908]
MNLLEIQDMKPNYTIPIKRVGFKGLWKRAYIESPLGVMPIDLEINAYVEIPEDKKGAHLSRNVEALPEDMEFPTKAKSIEYYLEKIHNSLLRLHSYAKTARVEAKTRYGVEIKFNDLSEMEPVDVLISVDGDLNHKRWSITVGLYGMTACPSAQSTISSIINSNTISPSHSQKVLLYGTIETEENYIIRIEDIARCLSNAFSAPSFTLLKRMQEANLVISAHKNPKFVEDVVRDAIGGLRCLTESLPENTVIKAEAISLESIHPHNVYAYSEGIKSSLPALNCKKLCNNL